jgi:transcriptional regulator with XRE-family HTH domain
VTGTPQALSVITVPAKITDPGWPYETFAKYLRKLMEAQGIADYAELSRLSGVNQTNLSNWRRGLARPSHDALRSIAGTLRVKPVLLWIQAGLVEPADLDLSEQPRFDVLPAPVRELVELVDDPHLPDDARTQILDTVSVLVSGFRARSSRR